MHTPKVMRACSDYVIYVMFVYYVKYNPGLPGITFHRDL